MYARSAGGLRWPGHEVSAAFGTVARAALTILCLAAVAAAVPAVRYLVFEYNHGDRQIVQRLFDSLLP
jgi:hypothetical protein